jgi:hypothetical protein
MIKFEIDDSKDGIELLLDAEGVDELINYLHFIKNNQESFHLVAGNELSEEASQNDNKIIKHVKLIYVD